MNQLSTPQIETIITACFIIAFVLGAIAGVVFRHVIVDEVNEAKTAARAAILKAEGIAENDKTKILNEIDKLL